MANVNESTADSTRTNTPNFGPDVLISSGFAEAGPSTVKDSIATSVDSKDSDARESALKARALKRAEKREKNHGLAMDLSKAGDALLELKDYAGACANYLHATRLWPSNDQTYLKLTGAYLKCELYSEATKAATRGLSFNPKSLEQRYLRGVARLEQQLFDAAKADLTNVLAHDPNHAEAKSKLDTIVSHIASLTTTTSAKDAVTTPNADAPISGAPSGQEESSTTTQPDPLLTQVHTITLPEIDFDFPKYEDDNLEIASLSDSSEANHYGNGIPCRFYNHTGCVKGQQCEFSHAPDEKSVRDDLGRNVCIYFLLDSCKFGVPKCVYSHSRQNLPTGGKAWWNDEKQRLKVKSVVEMAEARVKEAKEKKVEIKLEQKEKAAAAKKAKKKKAAEKAAAAAEEVVEEGQKADEAKVEGADEKVATEAKQPGKPKKKSKKTNGKKISTAANGNAAEDASTSAPVPTVDGEAQPEPQAVHAGEKKRRARPSRKQALAKRASKHKVTADAADSTATTSAPAKEESEESKEASKEEGSTAALAVEEQKA